MKKFNSNWAFLGTVVLIMILISASGSVIAQNVGIGTNNPVARLHVKDSNVVFSAETVLTDPPGFTSPILGAGTRMMWLPRKSAFRVGTLRSSSTNPDDETTYWDNDSIGLYSFAAGINPLASGLNSIALGSGQASGSNSLAIGGNSWARGPSSVSIGSFSSSFGFCSIAMGFRSWAEGDYSLAVGEFSRAVGESAISLGRDNESLGNASFSTGAFNRASGRSSTAMGTGNLAIGHNSTTLGQATEAHGEASLSSGYRTYAKSYASVVLGQYNEKFLASNDSIWVSSDPLLILGNGTTEASRSNAIVVYKNGNADINGYTQLGKSSEGAPAIKQKKITGYFTPTTANPNSFTFIPHGLNSSKILSISVLVNIVGNYDVLPHSPETGSIYLVNTDPIGGGLGPSIAVGVKSAVQSSSVMGRPIRVLITYEE